MIYKKMQDKRDYYFCGINFNCSLILFDLGSSSRKIRLFFSSF